MTDRIVGGGTRALRERDRQREAAKIAEQKRQAAARRAAYKRPPVPPRPVEREDREL